MKRIICLLLCLLAVTLCGCGEKKGPEPKLTENKKIELTFPCDTAAGFGWKYYVSDESILKITETSDEKSFSYTVTAKAAGETEVTFTSKREEDTDVALVAKYVFVTDSKNNINEKSHEGTFFK